MNLQLFRPLFFFALLSIIINFSTLSVFATEINDFKIKFNEAKTSLILNDNTIALEKFSELEKLLEPNKDLNPENKELYQDVIYNLALVYEQKYFNDSQNDINNANTGDLFRSDDYFKKSDPELWNNVLSMEVENGGEIQPLRAVGGIVGKVIKDKVKEWLNSKQNCNCSFSEKELNDAGSVFIMLTEKTDIPLLKDSKTRNAKIQEIFNRITNYLTRLDAANSMKQLYTNKIKVSCKI